MSTTIENPFDSIEKLEKLGFEGVDSSLAISLGEYGIAWRPEPDGRVGEYRFIYRHPYRPNRFDWGCISGPVEREFSWVEWEPFLACYGCTMEDFKALPYPIQISQLFNYYGALEIFGESYSEGFAIDGIEAESENEEI